MTFLDLAPSSIEAQTGEDPSAPEFFWWRRQIGTRIEVS